jgi:aminopeptidase-like protein
MQQFAGMDGTEARETIGASLYDLAAQLYPICRSITGDGVRETLRCLSQYIGIETTEVPTGTQVFDWTIPKEWNIRDAYIAGADGQRVVDFRRSNLHVLNYSTPVRGRFSLEDLKPHIYTLPEQPDLIPYRTSYYAERWGFSMTHNQLLSLFPGQYDVVIDSSLKDGHLTYGEYVHRGELADEVLLSAHICHPSLANDNCSGLAVLTSIAAALSRRKTRHTYRFLFAPGTIGAITWLSRNAGTAQRIKHGLVVSCLGDGGGPTYKKSRRGNAPIDRIMTHVLKHASGSAAIQDFSPYGYDERQYCSPGFNLPVGLFQRSQYGAFPEYHTSADSLDFIRPEHLAASHDMIMAAIEVLETDGVYRNTNPCCEPALGRRGLYATIGGDKDGPAQNMALLWVLNMSDGGASLLDIAERSGLAYSNILQASRRLSAADLLIPADSAATSG